MESRDDPSYPNLDKPSTKFRTVFNSILPIWDKETFLLKTNPNPAAYPCNPQPPSNQDFTKQAPLESGTCTKVRT
jgi:hypothetical protein